ncbi:MAG: PP2C family protein-serine/threonine phosphatase [Bryobacteraceae bacterium]
MRLRIRWGSMAPRGVSKPAASGTAATGPQCEATERVIIGKLMIEAFGASDPGCVRANNEDYFLLCPETGLYLVADGMGGANAGEHASKLAAETVREEISRGGEKSLQKAFDLANRRVIGKASQDPEMEGMGTTLVAVLALDHGLAVASVGDSRAYLAQKGRFRAITEDQTWVNEVGRKLGLSEESLKTHPMRHVLTMAIGVADQLRVHTYLLQPEPGAQVLLCSDGLHGVVSEEEIERALGSDAPLDAKCRGLIAAARAQGGPDNVTAVLLKVS